MDVRVWEPRSSGRGRIARFLEQNHIRHTRVVTARELGGLRRPALLIDDEIFVDPNDHALRRLLGVD